MAAEEGSGKAAEGAEPHETGAQATTWRAAGIVRDGGSDASNHTEKPIALAGSLSTGRDIVAALAMGADSTLRQSRRTSRPGRLLRSRWIDDPAIHGRESEVLLLAVLLRLERIANHLGCGTTNASESSARLGDPEGQFGQGGNP